MRGGSRKAPPRRLSKQRGRPGWKRTQLNAPEAHPSVDDHRLGLPLEGTKPGHQQPVQRVAEEYLRCSEPPCRKDDVGSVKSSHAVTDCESSLSHLTYGNLQQHNAVTLERIRLFTGAGQFADGSIDIDVAGEASPDQALRRVPDEGVDAVASHPKEIDPTTVSTKPSTATRPEVVGSGEEFAKGAPVHSKKALGTTDTAGATLASQYGVDQPSGTHDTSAEAETITLEDGVAVRRLKPPDPIGRTPPETEGDDGLSQCSAGSNEAVVFGHSDPHLGAKILASQLRREKVPEEEVAFRTMTLPRDAVVRNKRRVVEAHHEKLEEERRKRMRLSPKPKEVQPTQDMPTPLIPLLSVLSAPVVEEIKEVLPSMADSDKPVEADAAPSQGNETVMARVRHWCSELVAEAKKCEEYAKELGKPRRTQEQYTRIFCNLQKALHRGEITDTKFYEIANKFLDSIVYSQVEAEQAEENLLSIVKKLKGVESSDRPMQDLQGSEFSTSAEGFGGLSLSSENCGGLLSPHSSNAALLSSEEVPRKDSFDKESVPPATTPAHDLTVNSVPVLCSAPTIPPPPPGPPPIKSLQRSSVYYISKPWLHQKDLPRIYSPPVVTIPDPHKQKVHEQRLRLSRALDQRAPHRERFFGYDTTVACQDKEYTREEYSRFEHWRQAHDPKLQRDSYVKAYIPPRIHPLYGHHSYGWRRKGRRGQGGQGSRTSSRVPTGQWPGSETPSEPSPPPTSSASSADFRTPSMHSAAAPTPSQPRPEKVPIVTGTTFRWAEPSRGSVLEPPWSVPGMGDASAAPAASPRSLLGGFSRWGRMHWAARKGNDYYPPRSRYFSALDELKQNAHMTSPTSQNRAQSARDTYDVWSGRKPQYANVKQERRHMHEYQTQR